MTKSKITVLALAGALAACSSGVDQARQEMAESCFASANGRLTESECGCMADKAFASLDAEERAFVDKVYSLEEGISDAEAAERIGMERSEFNRLSRSYMSKVSDSSIGAAMECVSN